MVYYDCKDRHIEINGQWENDSPTRGIYLDKTAEDRYEFDGSFVNGKKEGEGTLRQPEYKIKGTWVDDKLQGTATVIVSVLKQDKEFVCKFKDDTYIPWSSSKPKCATMTDNWIVNTSLFLSSIVCGVRYFTTY
jgi:hypothetical protein